MTKKVIGESSFKKDFEKFSNIIERLLKELDFCREGENARQCTGDVELNITLAFSEFLATVYQVRSVSFSRFEYLITAEKMSYFNTGEQRIGWENCQSN